MTLRYPKVTQMKERIGQEARGDALNKEDPVVNTKVE